MDQPLSEKAAHAAHADVQYFTQTQGGFNLFLIDGECTIQDKSSRLSGKTLKSGLIYIIDPQPFRLHTSANPSSTDSEMFDRLMPLFAVIGVFSSLLYLILAAWAVYRKLFKKRR
ncbi:hypothetical protein ACOR62_07825 [Neisseria lisongii]|uniref:Uncharacterized protein n=1 Tax=Neisseria lisongii TaxID=2912188 RepID=A0AAW5AP38_9NEIS|nr:hypothetical protein [Neisseria lisongii]MCF7529698.1 hypothetical protein [Neisseria lisongii]